MAGTRVRARRSKRIDPKKTCEMTQITGRHARLVYVTREREREDGAAGRFFDRRPIENKNSLGPFISLPKERMSNSG